MQKSSLFPLIVLLSASSCCFAQWSNDCQQASVQSTTVTCTCTGRQVATTACVGTNSIDQYCSPTSTVVDCGNSGGSTCQIFRAVSCSPTDGGGDVVKKTTLASLIVPKLLIPSSITSPAKQPTCSSPERFEAWLQVHLTWNYQARTETPKTVVQK